jgi:hypothetical protein
MRTNVGLVDIPCIPTVWEEVSQLIEQNHAGWLDMVDLKEVYESLMMDKLDLWIGHDKWEVFIAMICGWERHAKASFYHIMWLGGRDFRPAMKAGMEKVERYACMQGAKEIRFGGREGWEKLLKPLGYVMAPHIEMRKNVAICWRN